MKLVKWTQNLKTQIAMLVKKIQNNYALAVQDNINDIRFIRL